MRRDESGNSSPSHRRCATRRMAKHRRLGHNETGQRSRTPQWRALVLSGAERQALRESSACALRLPKVDLVERLPRGTRRQKVEPSAISVGDERLHGASRARAYQSGVKSHPVTCSNSSRASCGVNPNSPPAPAFARRYGAICGVSFTDLMLDVALLRLRSNRLASLQLTPFRRARCSV